MVILVDYNYLGVRIKVMDKEAILKRISETDDDELLNQIEQLLDFAKEEHDFWSELTEPQKKDIQAGINDLDAGRSKKFEEVLRRLL